MVSVCKSTSNVSLIVDETYTTKLMKRVSPRLLCSVNASSAIEVINIMSRIWKRCIHVVLALVAAPVISGMDIVELGHPIETRTPNTVFGQQCHAKDNQYGCCISSYIFTLTSERTS